MAFLRVKKINNAKYLYLVGNKWYKRKAKGKGKGPRQKVIKYLGKVYSFEKANNSDFHYFKNINNIEEYIKNNEKSSIIRDLVEWELFRHHINKDEFGIDFDNKKILKGKKDVAEDNLMHLKNSRNSALSLYKENKNWEKVECCPNNICMSPEGVHENVYRIIKKKFKI